MDHKFIKIVWVLCIGIVFNSFALSVHASDADEYYSRGLKAYLSGDFKRASSELEQALKINDEHAPSVQLQRTIIQTRQQTNSDQGLLSQVTSALEAEQQQTQALKSLLTATDHRLTTLNEQSRSRIAAIDQLRSDASEAESKITLIGRELDETSRTLTDVRKDTQITRDQLNESLKQVKFTLKDAQVDLDQAKQSLQDLEKEKTRLNTQLAQAEGSLANLKKESEKTQKQFSEDLKLSKLNHDAIQDQLRQAESELEANAKLLKKTQKQLDSSEEEGAISTKEITKVRAEIKEGEAVLSRTEKVVEQLETEKADLKQQVHELSKGLDDTRIQVSELKVKKNEIEQLQRALKKSESDLVRRKKDNANLTEKVDSISDKLNQSEHQYKEADQKLTELNDAHQQLTDEKARQTYQSNAEINQLQGVKEGLEQQLVEERSNQEVLQRRLMASEKRETQQQTENQHLSKRVLNRDEQLGKLRGVHDTLERQYIEIESQRNQLEVEVQGANKERLNLKEQIARFEHDTIIARQESQQASAASLEETNQLYRKLQLAEENLEQVRSEFTALQTEHNDQNEEMGATQLQLTSVQRTLAEKEGLLRVESELTVGRERKFNEELDTLRNIQLQLEQRLTSSRGHNAKLEESTKNLQDANNHLQELLHDSDAQGRVAKSQIKDLRRSIEQVKGQLEGQEQTASISQENEKNVQQQLKIAKDSLKTLKEQIRQLTVARDERDELQGALSVREMDASKLERQVQSLKRELDMTSRKLALGDEASQQASQSAEIEQRGLELHVQSLERELRELRGFESKLRAELKARPPVGGADKAFVDQIVKKLAEREAQLKQAESVIELLQGSPGGLVPREASNKNNKRLIAQPSVISSDPSKNGESPTGEDRTSSAVKENYAEGAGHPVKIYQVNDELDFVVFSMEDESSWAETGANLLLVLGDQPVAKVRLTELDSAGFAVAQITQTLSRSRQIQKGDLLSARLLLSPVGQ